ncbi:MAG: elongation factor Tu, partial [Phycisphaerales bacterium]
TISNAYCAFDTKRYRYVHIDCPGHGDYVTEMIAGAYQMNAAIVVVSAVEGVMPQTCEHLLHARHAGVRALVVFLSMMDRVEDNELAELAEMETRMLLDRCGYDGAGVPAIRGSARDALEHAIDSKQTQCISDLLEALDKTVVTPKWDEQGPFFMPINQSFVLPGRGTILTGRVDSGRVGPRDSLELVGGDHRREAVKVKAIECFRESIPEAKAGHLVGIMVRGGRHEYDRRFRVLAGLGSTGLHDSFWADIQVLEPELGGRWKPIRNGYEPFFHFRTARVPGRLLMPKRHRKAPPGDRVTARVRLFRPVVVQPGWAFSAREGHRTILFGHIRELICRERTQVALSGLC